MNKYRLKGSQLYVQLPTELDHESSEVLKEETDAILAAYNVQSILFDFADTRFMDSSGIGVLMSRYRRLGMRKDCVAAANTDDRICKILLLSGMYKIIRLEDNSNQSLKGEGNNEGEHQ